ILLFKAHFDERSGEVCVNFPGGRWWQTLDEVYIELQVPEGTRGTQVVCKIGVNNLRVSLTGGQSLLSGDLPKSVRPDESSWTLADRRLLQIVLAKASPDPVQSCWPCLLVGQPEFEPDPLQRDQMEKKLTLQRFQYENPGMDFSGAEITGNYAGGGPQWSSS
uniref:CS domain-containing protein n=2 Tax=Macrostomum lignano TaxID=282301 RepID=A0A1I8GIK9_9PLAT